MLSHRSRGSAPEKVSPDPPSRGTACGWQSKNILNISVNPRSPLSLLPSRQTWQLAVEKMEIIPAHKTKRMLKRPGQTVGTAVASAGPRNRNLHPWQVSETPPPCACAGHTLRCHLPRCFCPAAVSGWGLSALGTSSRAPRVPGAPRIALYSPTEPQGPSPSFHSPHCPRAWAQTLLCVFHRFPPVLQA